MSDEDIVLAFGLVLAGTISTSLGSILLFIGKFDNISYLSMILGFAAGALLYISLFEIIEKSVDSFAESLSNGDTESKYPTLAAVACFYLGMMTIVLVETIIHKLNPHDHNMKEMLESVRIISPSSSSSSSSVEDNEHNHHHSHTTESQFSQHLLLPDDNNSGNINQSSPDITSRNNYRMKKMSAITAIAVALHNFPEGMATFAATLDDPSVGLSLTIAIIVHNLAVGICIAMPVYITTGSKLRAIGWATAAGASSFFGALIGYFILHNNYDETTFGILFGLVSGAMVQISIQDLIPTAFRHDPENSKVTKSIMAGIFVMSGSLLLLM